MKALVILSGGQDSATCLFWARKKFDEIHTITFDYGQRHRVELECARRLSEKFATHHVEVPVSSLKALGSNALVNPATPVREDGGLNNLPSTFVPGRNALFLTLAAAYAAPQKIEDLVIGACETDFSGYPDCRDVFMESMEKSLGLAMGSEFRIHRPLMKLNKAETFELAAELDALSEILENTHTCYEGDRSRRHDWGYGCGQCPACGLRRKGFEDYQVLQEKRQEKRNG
jgi:7-cyano-7-deazaguanine synthase